MKRKLLVLTTIAAAVAAIAAFAASTSHTAFPDPPAEQLAPAGAKKMTAVLAGGCFWGMQGVYEHVKGVTKTIVGYAGGEKKTARYETVSTGTTGHAESIEITYDPSVITYGQILKIYFSIAHDPTTLNQQGADIGTQYRSVIFYHSEDQRKKAEYYKSRLEQEGAFDKPIVTEIVPASPFYKAEDYHQNYYNLNNNAPYCTFVIKPKLEKFKKAFHDRLKK